MAYVIPKKIHYCWFGRGNKPALAIKCIESWKKYLPDYEIIEWNEDNFNINTNLFVKQAYAARKYAFVSDFVRLYALYHFGGIYMDTDVEVLKNLDVFLKKPAFSGFESNENIPTGIIGAVESHPWIGRLLNDYSNRVFIKKDGSFDLTPNTVTITNISKNEYGLKLENNLQVLNEGVYIYPSDYFCPKDWRNKELKLTSNSYTIHHFSGSWLPKKSRYKRFQNNIIVITYGLIIKILKLVLSERSYFKLKKLIQK